MSLAIVPGSFDPMTLGHLDVVEQALKQYDEVVVAVMVNAQKQTTFDMETRVAIAERTVEHLERVRVISDTGMLIDLFDELGADVIIKGIRGSADLEYEMIHAKWNKEHNPRLETLFLPADESLVSVSSTHVRELLNGGKYAELRGILADSAIEYLKEGK